MTEEYPSLISRTNLPQKNQGTQNIHFRSPCAIRWNHIKFLFLKVKNHQMLKISCVQPLFFTSLQKRPWQPTSPASPGSHTWDTFRFTDLPKDQKHVSRRTAAQTRNCISFCEAKLAVVTKKYISDSNHALSHSNSPRKWSTRNIWTGVQTIYDPLCQHYIMWLWKLRNNTIAHSQGIG